MVGLLTGWHSWLLYALLPLGWTAVLAAMAGRSATLQPKHKPVFSFRPAGEGDVIREARLHARLDPDGFSPDFFENTDFFDALEAPWPCFSWERLDLLR